MDSQSAASENQHLNFLLKKYKLWEKKSPFEHKSLLKALSNALFLTRTNSDYLQKKLLAFFLANVKIFARDFKLADFESIQTFVRDFYLPEHQNSLLILCSRMVKAPIELYHPEETDFRVETFGQFARAPLRIIRLYDGHYSALFPLESKVKFSIAQNIILNLVERAMSGPSKPFKLENRNNNQFENFEYQEWIEQTISNENFLFLGPSPAQPVNPKEYFELAFNPTDSTESVGSHLVSSLKNRRSRNSFHSRSDQVFKFDPDCEAWLAQLEKAARGKEAQKPESKPPLPHIPAGALEELGDIFYEPCDSFSYRDIEEILWKDTKSPETDIWMSPFEPQGLCPRAKSMNLGPAQTGMQRLYWNGSSECISQGYGGPLEPENIDSRMCNFRTVHVEEEINADCNFSRTDFPFKKALKPSVSEQHVGKQKAQDLKQFSLGFIQPFPEDESLGVDKGTPSKPQSKKKKKGESKVYRGELKFFDEKNNFGFLLTNINGKLEDVFVYRSEFDQAGIEMSTVRLAKHQTSLIFEFNLAFYFGKYQRSKKALNLRLVEVRRPQPE